MGRRTARGRWPVSRRSADVAGDPASRYWVDLADPSPELTQAVARRLGLHPLVAEDIEERNQRPKLELTGEHVHLVAFAIGYDREVRTDEIDFVLGRNVPADRAPGGVGSVDRPAPPRGRRPAAGARGRLPPVGAPGRAGGRLLPGLRSAGGRDRRPGGPDRRRAGTRHAGAALRAQAVAGRDPPRHGAPARDLQPADEPRPCRSSRRTTSSTSGMSTTTRSTWPRSTTPTASWSRARSTCTCRP